jgi:exonuclease VII small subunit
MPSIKASFGTISLFVLFIFACVAMVANAQELSPQERFEALQAETEANRAERAELRDDRQASVASSSEARQEIREARRVALTERLQQRITNLAANISNRMDAAIARLNQIAGRLEVRIDQLEAAGVDVTEAEAELNKATESLERAAGTISDIDAIMADVTGSESPAQMWQTGRDTFVVVKSDLQNAREALRASVAALKQAAGEAGLQAGGSSAVRQDEAGTPEAAEVGNE